MDKVNLAQVRAEFPMLRGLVGDRPLVYLDSAATTLKPQVVIDRITRFYSQEVANVHRGVHHLSGVATSHFEKVRQQVAAFLGAASDDEIVFTKGTTESINLVASTLGETHLGPGDEILTTDMEHHSNIVPWYMAAKRTGARLVFAPISDQGELELDKFKKCLNPKVKVVAITHCSNTLGTLNDLKSIIRAAKAVGALVLVDGAQGVAKEPVNVAELGCDFYAFSAHKLYGPFGVGVLYGQKQIMNQLSPYQGGGGMIKKVTREEITFLEAPFRFEAGTPNVSGVIGLGAAIEYFLGLGWEFVQSREYELKTYGLQRLAEVSGLKLLGRAQKRAPIFSFYFADLHAQDVGTLLDQQGVAVRTGHHCTQLVMQRYGVSGVVRASLCYYNSKEDVDALIAGLHKAKELLS